MYTYMYMWWWKMTGKTGMYIYLFSFYRYYVKKVNYLFYIYISIHTWIIRSLLSFSLEQPLSHIYLLICWRIYSFHFTWKVFRCNPRYIGTYLEIAYTFVIILFYTSTTNWNSKLIYCMQFWTHLFIRLLLSSFCFSSKY